MKNIIGGFAKSWRDNQMGLYDRELEGTDDIFNAVKEIVDKGNLGNKIEVVRMFQQQNENMN